MLQIGKSKEFLDAKMTEVPILMCIVFNLSFIFREGKGGRKRDRNIDVRETSIGCLPYAPQLGTKPAARACALMRNWTGDPSLCRMTPNQATRIRSAYPFHKAVS